MVAVDDVAAGRLWYDTLVQLATKDRAHAVQAAAFQALVGGLRVEDAPDLASE